MVPILAHFTARAPRRRILAQWVPVSQRTWRLLRTRGRTWVADLLVDEDAQDLADLAALLEARGFVVVRCRTHEQAMRAIRNELFDLAIVDQGSAAFEGRIVARCLSQFLPYTVFLVTARFADMKCYMEALKLGAEDYIQTHF